MSIRKYLLFFYFCAVIRSVKEMIDDSVVAVYIVDSEACRRHSHRQRKTRRKKLSFITARCVCVVVVIGRRWSILWILHISIVATVEFLSTPDCVCLNGLHLLVRPLCAPRNFFAGISQMINYICRCHSVRTVKNESTTNFNRVHRRLSHSARANIRLGSKNHTHKAHTVQKT